MLTYQLLRILLVIAVAAGLIAADKPVSDNLIYDQVRLKLSSDRDVRTTGIEVKVTEGVVELTGNVKNDKSRERAEKIAKKVKGVQKVVNKLKVVN